MNLIKRFKNQKSKFYDCIENAKYNINMAINSDVVELWYAKALGALDLAGNIGMIDFYEQIEIGNEVRIIRRNNK